MLRFATLFASSLIMTGKQDREKGRLELFEEMRY